MLEEERVAKIDRLKSLDAGALERENNAARNCYMLRGLGLSAAAKETLWGGADSALAQPKGAKRKAPNAPPGGRKPKGKRVKKNKVPETESEATESESSDADEGGEGAATVVPRAPRVPRKVGVTAGATPSPKPWALTAKLFLGNADLGPAWGKLLDLWWQREQSNGFEGTVSVDLITERGMVTNQNYRINRIRPRKDPNKLEIGSAAHAITIRSLCRRYSRTIGGFGGPTLTRAGEKP
jgi:hypothetical protein